MMPSAAHACLRRRSNSSGAGAASNNNHHRRPHRRNEDTDASEGEGDWLYQLDEWFLSLLVVLHQPLLWLGRALAWVIGNLIEWGVEFWRDDDEEDQGEDQGSTDSMGSSTSLLPIQHLEIHVPAAVNYQQYPASPPTARQATIIELDDDSSVEEDNDDMQQPIHANNPRPQASGYQRQSRAPYPGPGPTLVRDSQEKATGHNAHTNTQLPVTDPNIMANFNTTTTDEFSSLTSSKDKPIIMPVTKEEKPEDEDEINMVVEAKPSSISDDLLEAPPEVILDALFPVPTRRRNHQQDPPPPKSSMTRKHRKRKERRDSIPREIVYKRSTSEDDQADDEEDSQDENDSETEAGSEADSEEEDDADNEDDANSEGEEDEEEDESSDKQLQFDVAQVLGGADASDTSILFELLRNSRRKRKRRKRDDEDLRSTKKGKKETSRSTKRKSEREDRDDEHLESISGKKRGRPKKDRTTKRKVKVEEIDSEEWEDEEEEAVEDEEDTESDEEEEVPETRPPNKKYTKLPQDDQDLPISYTERFHQMGFCEFNHHMLPCLIVNPFDFDTSSTAHRSWMSMARKHLKEYGRLDEGDLQIFVYWYTDQTYSILKARKFVPWEEGKPAWKNLPKYLLTKLEQDKSLTEYESMRVEAHEECQEQASKPPSLRTHPQMKLPVGNSAAKKASSSSSKAATKRKRQR